MMVICFAIISDMVTDDSSNRDVLVDLTATRRLFMQLIDVHRFGDWRIFLDGEEPESTYTNPAPVVTNAATFAPLAAAGRRRVTV